MSLEKRLSKLEAGSGEQRFEVWTMDPNDDTVFHERDGRTMTREELDQQPDDPGLTRIMVIYVATPIPAWREK